MVKRAWDSRTVDGNGGGVRTRVDTERGVGRRTQMEKASEVRQAPRLLRALTQPWLTVSTDARRRTKRVALD